MSSSSIDLKGGARARCRAVSSSVLVSILVMLATVGSYSCGSGEDEPPNLQEHRFLGDGSCSRFVRPGGSVNFLGVVTPVRGGPASVTVQMSSLGAVIGAQGEMVCNGEGSDFISCSGTTPTEEAFNVRVDESVKNSTTVYVSCTPNCVLTSCPGFTIYVDEPPVTFEQTVGISVPGGPEALVEPVVSMTNPGSEAVTINLTEMWPKVTFAEKRLPDGCTTTTYSIGSLTHDQTTIASSLSCTVDVAAGATKKLILPIKVAADAPTGVYRASPEISWESNGVVQFARQLAVVDVPPSAVVVKQRGWPNPTTAGGSGTATLSVRNLLVFQKAADVVFSVTVPGSLELGEWTSKKFECSSEPGSYEHSCKLKSGQALGGYSAADIEVEWTGKFETAAGAAVTIQGEFTGGVVACGAPAPVVVQRGGRPIPGGRWSETPGLTAHTYDETTNSLCATVSGVQSCVASCSTASVCSNNLHCGDYCTPSGDWDTNCSDAYFDTVTGVLCGTCDVGSSVSVGTIASCVKVEQNPQGEANPISSCRGALVNGPNCGDTAVGLPAGSWTRSCDVQNYSPSTGTLTALCAQESSDEFGYLLSTLDVGRCSSEVQSYGGNLVCCDGPAPGGTWLTGGEGYLSLPCHSPFCTDGGKTLCATCEVDGGESQVSCIAAGCASARSCGGELKCGECSGPFDDK
jgi:hypothetical protein